MTDKQFYALFGEALSSTDRDDFVSAWALSSIWDDAPDTDIPKGRLTHLVSIWDAAHRSVRDITVASELSQRKLAERFCIPYRTMEDWCRGLRTPPDYVRLMMQRLLGLV